MNRYALQMRNHWIRLNKKRRLDPHEQAIEAINNNNMHDVIYIFYF